MKSPKHPVRKRSAAVIVATIALVATHVPAGAAQLGSDDLLETTEDSGLNIVDVLANDAPDAVITSYTQGSKGEVGEVKNAQGTIISLTYTPNDDANGADEFTYTATTEGGDVVSTVAVSIEPVADAPVAGDDDLPVSGEIVENAAAIDITADLLANDSDADDDALSIVSVTDAAEGTVTLVDGVVTYEPTSDTATSDTFTYTVSDGDETTADAVGSVSVTIVAVDDLPTAVDDDENVVDEGGSVNINVLGNDEDVDGGELAVATISDPANGTAEWSAEAGAIVYTHDDSEGTQTDSFTYTLNGGSEATVSISITPVDDAPTAADDTAEVVEGDSINIDVLDNDLDPDGGEKIVASISEAPAIGSAVIGSESGSVDYTHDGDTLGDVTFKYTVNGGSEATVTVTVTNGDDDPPVVEPPATLEIDEDASATPITVLTDGQTDADDNELSILSVGEATNGTAALVDGAISYTPNADFYGDDSFSIVVTDGDGGDDDVTLTANVVVAAINDAPEASDDFYTEVPDPFCFECRPFGFGDPAVQEDTPTTLLLLENDSDIDSTTLSVEPDSLSLDAEIGTLEVVEGGVLFTPADDYFGSFSFTYRIMDGPADGEGTLFSNTATVSVVVVNTEDPLIAVEDEATVAEDDVINVDVMENDIDVDETGFELLEVTQPDGGFAAVAGDLVRVQPDPNFAGVLEIEYTIRAIRPVQTGFWGPGITCEYPIFFEEEGALPGCELITGNLLVEVEGVNDRPEAAQDEATTDEDTPVTIDVLANDTDADADELAIDRTTQGRIGTVEIVDGQLVYTPDQDANGTDSFIYYATDGDLLSVALVSVEITPVNDDPTIEGRELVIDEDTDARFVVSIADIDSEELTVELTGGPTDGSVVVSGTSIIYTPPINFFGEVGFELTVSDDDEASSIGEFTVTVESVNDEPTAEDLSIELNEDTDAAGTIEVDDVEQTDDQLLTEIGTEPELGSVALTGTSFVYTPDENANGEDSFTVVITDLDGASVESTVSVNIEPVNDAPEIAGQTVETDEDTAVEITVETTDVDGDDLTLGIESESANGEIEIDGMTATFTPATDWHGEATFDLNVTDGESGNDATFTVTVASVNDEPTAEDLSIELDEDTDAAGTIDVTDVEDSDAELLTEIGTEPELGTVVLTGTSFVYTANENANGEDSFTVVITDLDGASVESTVSVSVIPVNDAPEIEGRSVETDEDTGVDISVVATDVDEDDLTLEVSAESANGEVTIDGLTATFTPAPDWHGETTFDLTVTDGEASNDATFTVTVASVNDEPTISAETLVIDEDTSGEVEFTTADIEDDFAERLLEISLGEQPAKGTAELVEGAVVYTPEADENGDDEFELIVTDSEGASVSTVVEVSVSPVNDDPTAAECDSTSVVNNAEIEFDPRVCGSDIDGDELAVVEESLEATNGTAALVDGMVVFTPAAGFVGEAEVRFLLSDGEGEPAESSIQVEITSPYVGVSGQDGQLVRIYSAMLGRLPDDLGFSYWTEMMDQGVQLSDLVTYFGTSEEFGNIYGDRLLEDTNEEWIEFVYGEILDRGSDEAGKAYYLDLLDNGEATREQIVVFFAESEEYKLRTQTS